MNSPLISRWLLPTLKLIRRRVWAGTEPEKLMGKNALTSLAVRIRVSNGIAVSFHFTNGHTIRNMMVANNAKGKSSGITDNLG